MELNEIRDQINKLATDMSAIMATAKTEKRELTQDENTKFDVMDTDRDKLMATERRMAKVAQFDQAGGRRSDPPPTEESRQQRQEPQQRSDRDIAADVLGRAEAMQGWLLGGKPGERTKERREAAQKFGLTLEQKELTFKLAPVALRSLRDDDVNEWEKRYLGVDVISPDNGGHYVVPNEMMRSLETALLSFGGMRQVATVIRTNTGAHLPIPTMNDTANEGAIVGESVQTTELEPTLNQVVLDAYKYSSRKIVVSVEFLQDNAINASGVIGRLLGERIARITNRHCTVGTGSSQPNGIVTAATSSAITTATATAFTYTELMDLEHSVDPAYRASSSCKWMFNDTTLKGLKKIMVPQFSGDTAGYPLWRAGMATKEPDTIDGYAYVINQHMPAPTAALKAIVFGDLSKYMIRDVRDITLVRLDELYAEYRQVVFLAWMRFDGDLLDAGTHPVKYLSLHA